MTMSGADTAELQIIPIQPCLHGLAGELGRDGLEPPEPARDRDELRVKFLAENARAYISTRTRHRAPTKGAVHVHAAIRHDLGAVADGCGDNEVAMACVHALTGAHWCVRHQRRHRELLWLGR